VVRGIGDDAAVLRLAAPVLVTTDVLVEGVHFKRDWGTPRQLGRKAFVTAASDIAAMGGRSVFALIDLRAPASTAVVDLDGIYRGFRDTATRAGTRLVGGNTCRAAALSIGVTLLGEAPNGWVGRDGCRPGDDLFVSGTLGLAGLGLRLLRRRRGARGPAVRRFLEPPSRLVLAQGLARLGGLGGMIDVSDGCLRDLGHLCAASRVGAVVDAGRLPLAATYRRLCGDDLALALTAGEDYELLFSARPGLRRRLIALARARRCPLTRIGRIVARPEGVRVLGAGGRELRFAAAGHDHFRR
jgi:thiamine-monophosphate kinase